MFYNEPRVSRAIVETAALQFFVAWVSARDFQNFTYKHLIRAYKRRESQHAQRECACLSINTTNWGTSTSALPIADKHTNTVMTSINRSLFGSCRSFISGACSFSFSPVLWNGDAYESANRFTCLCLLKRFRLEIFSTCWILSHWHNFGFVKSVQTEGEWIPDA